MGKCKCDYCGEEMEFSKMYMHMVNGDIKTAKKGHKGCMFKLSADEYSSKEG